MAANTFAFEPSTSHYKALGISRSATEEDITRAFKKLSLIYHPDKAGEQSTGTFQHLVNARDTLLNQIKRSEYDDEHEDDSLTEAEGALLCGKLNNTKQINFGCRRFHCLHYMYACTNDVKTAMFILNITYHT